MQSTRHGLGCQREEEEGVRVTSKPVSTRSWLSVRWRAAGLEAGAARPLPPSDGGTPPRCTAPCPAVTAPLCLPAHTRTNILEACCCLRQTRAVGSSTSFPAGCVCQCIGRALRSTGCFQPGVRFQDARSEVAKGRSNLKN